MTEIRLSNRWDDTRHPVFPRAALRPNALFFSNVSLFFNTFKEHSLRWILRNNRVNRIKKTISLIYENRTSPFSLSVMLKSVLLKQILTCLLPPFIPFFRVTRLADGTASLTTAETRKPSGQESHVMPVKLMSRAVFCKSNKPTLSVWLQVRSVIVPAKTTTYKLMFFVYYVLSDFWLNLIYT